MTPSVRNSTGVNCLARTSSISCTHNAGTEVMNCEFAHAGVETVEDEGRVVISCGDYERKGE